MTDDAGRGHKDQFIGNPEFPGSGLRNGQGVRKALPAPVAALAMPLLAITAWAIPDLILSMIEKDRRRLEAVRREDPGRRRRARREDQRQIPAAVRLDPRMDPIGEKSGHPIVIFDDLS